MIPAHSSGASSASLNPGRQVVHEGVRDHHVLGVPAGEVPAGVERRRAQVLLAAPAELARPVGAAEPGRADPVAGLEPGAARAGRDDLGHHLVARRHVRLLGRQVAFGQVQVGPAHPAAADLEQQLAGAGLGYRPLGELERARGHRPGLMDHPRAHGPTVGRLGQARVNRASTEMVAGPRSMPSWFQVMPNWARSISASARTVTAASVTSSRVAVKVSGRVTPPAVS